MSEIVQSERKLSPKQNKALAVLLEGGNKGEAAQAANVATKTVQRWTNEDVLFCAELQRLKDSAVKGAGVRYAVTLDMSIDTFRSVMADKEIAPGVRIRAANYAATHAARMIEIDDILQRIEALEAKL